MEAFDFEDFEHDLHVRGGECISLPSQRLI